MALRVKLRLVAVVLGPLVPATVATLQAVVGPEIQVVALVGLAVEAAVRMTAVVVLLVVLGS